MENEAETNYSSLDFPFFFHIFQHPEVLFLSDYFSFQHPTEKANKTAQLRLAEETELGGDPIPTRAGISTQKAQGEN